MHSEIEAKLLVEKESDLDALARLTRLGSYRLRPHPVRELLSTYFDSRDLVLSRRAMALRVRRHGLDWEATLKWAGSVHGNVHERPELNIALPHQPSAPPRPWPEPMPLRSGKGGATKGKQSALPSCSRGDDEDEGYDQPSSPPLLSLTTLPPDLFPYVVAPLAGRKLVPVLVTEIQRLAIDVLDSSATEVLAEIALDRVLLRSPNSRDPRRERYCEVEIERKKGSRSDIARITQRLRSGRRMHPSPDSKLVRGLRLLYGEQAWQVPAVERVQADDNVAEATCKIVATQLERLLGADPAVRIGNEPEAVHAMRVAIRRLRVVVQLLPDGFDPVTQHRLRRELRWLGQLLGAVRDCDVLLQHLATDRAKLSARRRPLVEEYARYVAARRQQCRTAMRTGLESQRYARLLRLLEDFAPAPGVSVLMRVAGAIALRKAYKKLSKGGDRIGKQPTADELHAVRIRAKRLRYLTELLLPWTERHGKRLLKRMVELQDVLGAHNDSTVAGEDLGRFLEAQEVAPATRRAVANLQQAIEARAVDARAQFRAAWRRFSHSKTEREMESIMAALLAPSPRSKT